MKKLITTTILLFIITTQSIPVKALDSGRVIDLSQAQTVHSLTAPKGLGEDIRDEVNALNNEPTADIQKFKRVKNNVYNELSDYMKIKYHLYDIHIVEDLHDISIYKDEPKRTLGLITQSLNYIMISNNTSGYSRIVDDTLFHELGHALDLYDITDNSINYGHFKYSGTDEFKKIFEDEVYDLKKLSKEYYFTDKVSEYFAESYAIYMENPDRMERIAPKTYEFIDRVANQVYTDVHSEDYNVNKIKELRLNPILDLIKSEKNINVTI